MKKIALVAALAAGLAAVRARRRRAAAGDAATWHEAVTSPPVGQAPVT